MNASAIDSLAEAVWRRVIGFECSGRAYEHAVCTESDPDDCALFREIHDEVVMWATAQRPEAKNVF